MRKLFTLGLAIGFTLMANAAKWDANTDITQSLEDDGVWGDVSGWWSAGGYEKNGGVNMQPYDSKWWHGDQPNEMAWSADDHNKQGYAAMGFYSDGAGGSLIDSWQLIPLPAGVYTISFNATYREGTPDATWLSYQAHQPKQNSHFYVNVLTENDPDAEPVQAFDRVISSLAGSTNVVVNEDDTLGRLYFDSDGSWKNDKFYLSISGTDSSRIWYPNSDEGASMFFEKDYYLHKITFYLTEDGYIRFGFRKTENIAQDWLVWAGIKMTYEGELDDDWKKVVAQNDLRDLKDELVKVQAVADDASILGLSSYIEDFIFEINDQLKSSADYADVIDMLAKTKEVRQLAADALGFASLLSDFIAMSEEMANDKIIFEKGIDAFVAAIETAKSALAEENFGEFEDPADAFALFAPYYQNAVTVLSGARAAYLNSQDFDEEGYKNFTGLVKFPWLVQPQYNAELCEDGLWRIIQDPENRDLWKHDVVQQGPSEFYKDGKPNGGVVKNGRIDVCSGVNLYGDGSKAGTWYQTMDFKDGWSSGLKLMYQGGLVGFSDGWNSGIKDGSLMVSQRVEGLPEGYYQIRCLMRGQDPNGNWNKKFHNAYATNGKSTTTSPVGDTDSHYSPQHGWSEWNGNVWKEHRTGIIGAPEGTLTIGAQSSMVMNVTGFRIYFFGTNPDFPNLVKEDISELQNCLDGLTFKGDYNYVNGLYEEASSIDCTNNSDLYEKIVDLCTTGKKYTEEAVAAVGKYTAVEDYYTLQGKYEEGSNGFNMIAPAITFAEALGGADQDTYEDANAAMTVLKAYQSYFAAYDKAIAITSPLLFGIVANHVNVLTAGYCNDADQLAAMQKEIEDVYATEYVLAAASNADELNPADITGIIINADFTDPTKGWEGETATQNDYARGNSELWNKGSFVFSQTLKMLPAGKYMVQCNALYRDGNGGETGNDTNSPITRWIAAGKDINTWATPEHNVTLFMNNELGDTVKAYVNSVCAYDFEEPSFKGWFKDVEGKKYAVEEDLSEETLTNYRNADGTYAYDEVYQYGKPNNQQYPWDTRFCENAADTVNGGAEPKWVYFPESMFSAGLKFDRGFYLTQTDVFTNSANADVKIGLQKVGSYKGDWVIFGHFKLFCLGINTGIEAAKTAKAEAAKASIYNLAGQKVNASFKGIVVKNGKKMLNK